MPHRPEPWYREPRQTWFVQIDGKQIPLAKGPKDETESAAYAAYFKLMAGRKEDAPPPSKLLVRDLCERFLDFSEKHHSTSCYDNYRYFLDSYCERYGGKLAADQKVHHVTAWLDSHQSWKGARRHGILAIKRAFSWAEKQDLLTSDPLRKVPQEAGGRRTRVLTKDEQAEILAAIRDEPSRQFMRAMFETGARSSEVARVTAANVNLELGIWAFDEHKTAKKTLKARVVYLTPAIVELSRELMAKFPEGPLFRGPRGKKPFKRNNVRCRFRRLRKKLPHLKHFVANAARHTFATQALVNKVGTCTTWGDSSARSADGRVTCTTWPTSTSMTMTGWA